VQCLQEPHTQQSCKGAVVHVTEAVAEVMCWRQLYTYLCPTCVCVFCVLLQSSLAVTVDPVDRAMRVRAGVVFPGPDWRVDTYDRVTKEVELVQVRGPHNPSAFDVHITHVLQTL
jgi:hypothetical protein